MSSYHLLQLIVSLAINCGAVLTALLSIASALTNTTMGLSLRGILSSFSLANAAGATLLTYDAVIRYYGDERLSFVVTITMTLSLAHLLLLTLHFYKRLVSPSEKSAKDFVGLILVSWIASVMLGCVDVATINHGARVSSAVVYLLIVLFILSRYYMISNKERLKKYAQGVYETFLKNGSCSRRRRPTKCWKLKFIAMLILSYVACSLPWVANELIEVFQGDENDPLIRSILLIIYSLNFYFPSLVCMYLRFKYWKSEKSGKCGLRSRIHIIYQCKGKHLILEEAVMKNETRLWSFIKRWCYQFKSVLKTTRS